MAAAEDDLDGGSGGGTHGVKRGASVFTSVCNLANCAIGAGVLSLPFAMREMGAALGLLLAVLVAGMIVFTLNTLLKAGERHDAVSYQELVLKALGPAASHLVSLTLIIYIFGSCVAYTIIIADSFTAVLVGTLGADSQLASRDGVILLVAATVLLPLSLLRRTNSLAPASTLAVVALLYTTAAVVVKGCINISEGGGDIREGDGGAAPAAGAVPPPPPTGGGGGKKDWKSGSFTLGDHDFDLWRIDAGTVLALPILVFAFQCHIQVLSIFAELRDEPGEGGGANNGSNGNNGSGTGGGGTGGTGGGRSSTGGRNSTGGGGAGAGARRSNDDQQPGLSPSSSTSSLSMLLSPSPGRAGTNQSQTRVVDIGGDGTQSDRLVAVDEGGGVSVKTEGFKTRRRATMERVVAASILMCLIGYALVGEFAYITHPDVQSNMLNSYGTKDPWMLAASASMGLSAIGSYPINHFSSRAALDDLLSAAFGWRAAAPGMAPAGRHVPQTLLFLVLTTAASLRVRDLGRVFQLVGSTAGVLVICIIPGLLVLQPAPGCSSSASVSRGGSRRGAGRSGARGGGGGGDDDDIEEEQELGDGDDIVGEAGPRRGTRARRHWTEGGGSFGGYDELGAMAGGGGVDQSSGGGGGGIIGSGIGAPSFRDMTHADLRAALLPQGSRHEREEEVDVEDATAAGGGRGGGGGGGSGGGSGSSGSGVVAARRGKSRWGGGKVSAADAVRGYGLLILGVLISASNIYVLFFSDQSSSASSGGDEKHS
jgi:amino acid permease